MEMGLDLYAVPADSPTHPTELASGNAPGFSTVVTTVSVASVGCASECLGTMSTITCGPCVSSF